MSYVNLFCSDESICRTSLETDLRVERDFRQRLQETLTSEKNKVSHLQFEIHELNLIKQV